MFEKGCAIENMVFIACSFEIGIDINLTDLNEVKLGCLYIISILLQPYLLQVIIPLFGGIVNSTIQIDAKISTWRLIVINLIHTINHMTICK